MVHFTVIGMPCLSAVPIVPNPDNSPWCYEPPPPPAPSPSPPPVEGNLTITIDLVDLYLVPPPLPQVGGAGVQSRVSSACTIPSPQMMQPSGSLSVVSKGADPTGKADSTAAFVTAVSAARDAGVAVWVPPGNFTVTAHVVLDDVTVLGAGSWYSVLHGDGVGLYGAAPPQGSANVQV